MSSSQDLKNSQANIAPQRKSSARNDVPEWATDMIVEYRKNEPRAAAYPYTQYRGKAHVNLKTNDTLHVSAVLKKTEDRKSSGVTVHLYPNGKVVPGSRKLSEITVKGAVIENVAEDADKFLEKSKV
ncbi:hypothetical protein E4U30_007585 [Claviceps sp. LM220 group G6]|nr:hypothetical protein E4U15_004918 [Claviceps sp. LM218 group G6]KAG6091054.1 hypothetical protein E4U30_007585 [Claviceps sp. LM220 group G6]KAG6097661.1 hypothetical protein E4U31_005025 [Claviceps sp. LM219 group G6]